MDALRTLYTSRDDFASTLSANPDIAYTRNAVTEAFDIGTSTGGLQFVLPVATDYTGSGSTGDFVATYRYYDGMSIPSNDASGGNLLLPTRLIGDITQDDVQQLAFDVQVTYDEQKPSNISIDLYLNPYIININLALSTTESGDTQIDVTLDLFGPASCNFNIEFTMVNQGDIFDDTNE